MAENAVHVTVVAWLSTAMVRSDGAPLPIPTVRESFLESAGDTVARLNELAPREFTARDPRALADRLPAYPGNILRADDFLDPTKPVV